MKNSQDKFPRYTIEIDEEGFPVFGGLRVDDNILLRDLFQNLRRRNAGDLRSALVTLCDGEECFVDAFSAPLIAQSVDDIGPETSTWNFLGERREKIRHADLRQDEWGRLHTWIGAEKIHASLRSKAQAEFFHAFHPDQLTALHIPPFRSMESDVNRRDFWDQCYRDQSDGWEMGGPTPVLTQHFTEVRLKIRPPGPLLVPGCGRAHDAAYLAQQGFQTTALDFSEEGLAAAKKIYGKQENLKFVKDDVFDFLKSHPEGFGAIFEHTIFCAIAPDRRAEFIARTAGALAPSGWWFGIFFLRSGPGGPPFGLTQWELREQTREFFEVFDWKLSPHSATPRKNQELWAVFRRRPL